ncbi:MAG: hypothetical protein JNM27_23355 [Leptospirales bacterium]|nr:hypothetical protein [Leptospirales bacterium]
MRHLAYLCLVFSLCFIVQCSSGMTRTHYPALSGVWNVDLEWTMQDETFKRVAGTDPDAIQKARFMSRVMSMAFREDSYSAVIDFRMLSPAERAEGDLPDRAIEDSVKVMDSRLENGVWRLTILGNKSRRLEVKMVTLLSEDHLKFAATPAGAGDFPLHFRRKR